MTISESGSGEEATSDWTMSAENISKSFGTIQAVDSVDIELKENEVLAVVGDNGAGKSTLLYSIIGLHDIDDGTIKFSSGRTFTQESQKHDVLGKEVGMVHQETALVGIRPVYENVFMGRQLTKSYLGGLVEVSDKKKMQEEAKAMLAELGFDIPVNKETQLLSGGQRQILSFARALYTEPPILVLDEPFTALSEEVINKLKDTIRTLKQDHSILIVSHNLEMVREIADRIVVMRRGEKVANLTGEEIEREDILRMMVG